MSRPASGLVTGLEPMVADVAGTWIAHGGGSADREVSPEGVVQVPPDDPTYELSRIWLSDEEIEGYYQGFANEALWPLCHLVYVRPRFRERDFTIYSEVNEKFAERASAIAGDDGIVLVQDYHFALVPAALRQRNPDVTISTFWHIPWPPREIWRICPWARELIEGLIASDIIGFHIDEYGEAFLDCADDLGFEVDREAREVRAGEHTAAIRTYPISVEWSEDRPSRQSGRDLAAELGLDGMHIALGVDRIDYTKGLPERIEAIELFLENYPDWHGRWVHVQLGSPSRTALDEYATVTRRFHEAVDRVNSRFASDEWRPVVLVEETLSRDQLDRYFAMADTAIVTSLHDGMNLVAKEYIVSCVDDAGALILSQFAGAAEELDEAIQVNPWDTVEVAGAIHAAAVMGDAERTKRMTALRNVVRNHTIHDWARLLLRDAREVAARRQ